MQLSDSEDANEHVFLCAVVQWAGGEPQGAVGDAAALRLKEEQVGALFDRLRAGWKTIVKYQHGEQHLFTSFKFLYKQ